ncbi:alpha/beta hydrolase [Congzhengia sp.]|uniref:alpha/beta hydrolase n=1 Tax=Congzhengia sp. TaxID=2944168 RepID=UPI0030786431
MAINKLTKAALAALSYPELDVRKTYKINRKIQRLIHPPIALTCTIEKTSFQAEDGFYVPARIFTPKNLARKAVLLFFHGGGWVVGDVDSYTATCASLAESTKSRVIALDYRLAPEFAFPYAVNDSYSALCQVEKAFGKPIVIGDSAGGNIAAVVCQMARDRGGPPVRAQILIYPATFHDHTETSPFASVKKFGEGFLLTAKRICEYMDLYVQDKRNLSNPYFAPLLAEDLSNLPPALLITAECDPLRDEGEEYARRLWLAKTPVQTFRIEDALHGFFSLPATFEQVKKCHRLIDLFLNETCDDTKPDTLERDDT